MTDDIYSMTKTGFHAAIRQAKEEALLDAADAMTRELPGAGPWGVPQHEHQAQWLRERAAEIRSAK